MSRIKNAAMRITVIRRMVMAYRVLRGHPVMFRVAVVDGEVRIHEHSDKLALVSDCTFAAPKLTEAMRLLQQVAGIHATGEGQFDNCRVESYPTGIRLDAGTKR